MTGNHVACCFRLAQSTILCQYSLTFKLNFLVIHPTGFLKVDSFVKRISNSSPSSVAQIRGDLCCLTSNMRPKEDNRYRVTSGFAPPHLLEGGHEGPKYPGSFLSFHMRLFLSLSSFFLQLFSNLFTGRRALGRANFFTPQGRSPSSTRAFCGFRATIP